MRENDESDVASKEPKSWLTFLDRATEYKFCLLVLSAVLAIDLSLQWGDRKNLLSFDWNYPNQNFHLGTIMIVLASYLFYMAVIASLLKIIADRAIKSARRQVMTIESLLPDKQTSKSQIEPSALLVRPSALRKEAMQEKDVFELRLFEEYETKRVKFRHKMEQLAYVSFSCVILTIVEMLNEGSVIHDLTSNLPWYVDALIVLLIGLPWLLQAWDDDPDPGWIDYPPLAQKIRRKWREEQGLKDGYARKSYRRTD